MPIWILFLYFFLEVVVTIQIGGAIGGIATFLAIILTALIGFWLLRSFKTILGESLMGLVRGHHTVKTLVASNMLSLLGALLLIIPGFLSDIIGALMQLGFITTFFANRLGVTPKNQPFDGQENFHYEHTRKYSTKKGEDDVIDVEIVEHTKRIDD